MGQIAAINQPSAETTRRQRMDTCRASSFGRPPPGGSLAPCGSRNSCQLFETSGGVPKANVFLAGLRGLIS